MLFGYTLRLMLYCFANVNDIFVYFRDNNSWFLKTKHSRCSVKECLCNATQTHNNHGTNDFQMK